MIYLSAVSKHYIIEKHRRVVLDNASINFEAGKSYAVLGINGAGKSTLIRLLAGTEFPNRGKITRTVRVSWPLGFSGGLHPNMTGRQNVQFVARAYGVDERRTSAYVEDFAEIGPYIDAKVMTYSSGMIARLAFGLSMAIPFECYLIDEVLGVGDARFQARCKAEFDSRRRNADIIMVSHDMSALTTYCGRAVVVADGRLYEFDNVERGIEIYKRLNM
jgi:capsular polysaccharide transport system ATP-binding protein